MRKSNPELDKRYYDALCDIYLMTSAHPVRIDVKQELGKYRLSRGVAGYVSRRHLSRVSRGVWKWAGDAPTFSDGKHLHSIANGPYYQKKSKTRTIPDQTLFPPVSEDVEVVLDKMSTPMLIDAVKNFGPVRILKQRGVTIEISVINKITI